MEQTLHAPAVRKKIFSALALSLSAMAHAAAISFLWQTHETRPSPPLQVAMVQIAGDKAEAGSSAKEAAADGGEPMSDEAPARRAQEEKPAEPGSPEASESDDSSAAYIDAAKVNTQPVLLVDVPPTLARTIPDDLSSVVLRLLINEQGKVDHVVVEDESLPQKTRQALVDGFSKVEFRPALMQQRPVKVQLRIEVSVGDRALVH